VPLQIERWIATSGRDGVIHQRKARPEVAFHLKKEKRDATV
jgi:hypothetical protein